jgi:nicotinamide-nucleotide amidase
MKDSSGPRIEILAIGAELLTPYYVDTNSLFLTKQLNRLGMRVVYKTVVGDDKEDLAACIRTARQRSDLIFAMGGLGPTQDDMTREVFADTLEKRLTFHPNLWKQIRLRFQKRGISISEVNRKQAFILEGAEALENPNGTAPGMWIQFDHKIWVLLPGPPRELEPMFVDNVLPRLTGMRRGYQAQTTLKITGLTESQTETDIADLYPGLGKDVRCTVLAAPGQIEIHLSAFSEHGEEEAERMLDQPTSALRSRLGLHVFTSEKETLEEVVGRRLHEQQSTLAVAESCTGGLLGHRITNVPGSSRYFLEGVQVYSNQAKIRLLNVSPALLERHGAVSAEVAACMAENVRKNSGADFGLGITGVAGPDGGTPGKPVGLVFISLASSERTQTEKNLFLGDRETIKRRATQKALDMLRLELREDNPGNPTP